MTLDKCIILSSRAEKAVEKSFWHTMVFEVHMNTFFLRFLFTYFKGFDLRKKVIFFLVYRKVTFGGGHKKERRIYWMDG